MYLPLLLFTYRKKCGEIFILKGTSFVFIKHTLCLAPPQRLWYVIGIDMRGPALQSLTLQICD